MRSDATFVAKTLVPRKPPRAIRRPRLIDQLGSAADADIVIIRAPAGFGKTTLLVDLANEAHGIVYWLSLDEWDRDPSTFLHYLNMSISRASGADTIPEERTQLPSDPQEALAQIASALADREGESWILLDDFHCLDGAPEAVTLVDYLARRLPPGCKLALASRTPPPLSSLPRLRLADRVAELDDERLAFTADEIQRYYESVRGLRISTERSERLREATHGWPAAIALIADPTQFDGQQSSSPIRLSDYLAWEVFHGLPEPVRDFLLRTSVLDSLDVTVCDSVLGGRGSAELLRALESQNVPLIRVRGDEPQYRIHPLFRDFLRHRLRMDSEKTYKGLHRKAGLWMADHDRLSDAIWHLAQAEDWDQVAELILEKAPGVYKAGRWHTITAWLEAIPGEELARRPELQLWEARLLVRLGRADDALRVISAAVDGMRDADHVALAQLETLRGTALRVKGEVAWALSSCRRGVDLAAQANAPVGMMAEARKQLGQALFVNGSFPEAVKELSASLEFYEHHGDSEESAFVSGCLGCALGETGRLEDSLNHLERARRLWHRIGNAKELCWVLNNLAVTYDNMGRTDSAIGVLDESIARARSGGNQRAEAYALTSLADIRRRAGDHHAAVTLYESALALAGELGEMTVTAFALTGLSHSYRQAGNGSRAEVLAAQALASAQDRESPFDEGLARMAFGNLQRQRGELDEAIASFSLATSLFEKVNAKRERIEALFLLADAALPDRQSRTLLRITLEKLAQLCADMGHDFFLLREATGKPAVVEYGASKKIAGGFYRDLLRRMIPTADQDAQGEVAAGHLPAIAATALGKLEVRMDGRKIRQLEWESEKSKELLLFLLTEGRPLSRDEVVAALWPDSDSLKASSSFHSTLHRLRRALYPESVVVSGGKYSLNRGTHVAFDVTDFETAVQAVKADLGGDQFVEALRAALSIYRGPFAPGLNAEWAEVRRRRLEASFIEVAVMLADRLLAVSAYGEAADVCRRVLDTDPYNEAACMKLMHAQAAAEDFESALRSYRLLSETLNRDLGVEPGQVLQEMYEMLRRGIGRRMTPPS